MALDSLRAALGSQDRVSALLRWVWSRLGLRRPLLRLVLATAGCAGPSPAHDQAHEQISAGSDTAAYALESREVLDSAGR